LSGEVKARFGRAEFCRRNDLDPARPIVSFLPGSRLKELQRILPPMLDAIKQLYTARPDIQAVAVVAPSRTAEETRVILSQHDSANIKMVQHQTREALAASDAAAVASGTATLEAALLETRGRVWGPSGAAAKLGIPPSTLDHRIKSLKINKKHFKYQVADENHQNH